MASMNAGIILGGQPVDVMGAMDRGRQAAESQLALTRQNEINALMRAQGPGIMAGEQGALNALAQFDPQAALGIQNTRLGMDQTRLQMDVLSESEKRAAAEYARGLGKEAAAAEAAKIESAVKAALLSPDAASFDAMMMQMGQQDLVGQFDNRQALAARFMSMAEVLTMTAPPDPMDALDLEKKRLEIDALRNPPGPEWRNATPEEAARYGATAGQISTKTGEFKKTGDGNGITQTIRNPDGTETTIQIGGRGGAGGGGKFTEGQSKDNVYATRAEGALAKLEAPAASGGTVADGLSSLPDNLAARIPVVGNYLTDEGYQVAETAGQEFLQAILRKDTGAAITAQEQALYGETYLPRPGDSPQRLAYKKEARVRALEALKSGMSVDQLATIARAEAQIMAALAAGDAGAPPPAAGGATPAAPAGATGDISDDDLLRMYGGE